MDWIGLDWIGLGWIEKRGGVCVKMWGFGMRTHDDDGLLGKVMDFGGNGDFVMLVCWLLLLFLSLLLAGEMWCSSDGVFVKEFGGNG